MSPSAHPLISEHKVGQSGLGVGGGTPNANSAGRGLWREASPHGRRPSPGTTCAGRAGEARKPLSVGTQSTSLRGTLGPDLPGPKTTRSFLERIRTPRGREAAGPPHRTTPPLLLEGTDLERWPTGEVTVTPNHSWSVPCRPREAGFPVSGRDAEAGASGATLSWCRFTSPRSPTRRGHVTGDVSRSARDSASPGPLSHARSI